MDAVVCLLSMPTMPSPQLLVGMAEKTELAETEQRREQGGYGEQEHLGVGK